MSFLIRHKNYREALEDIADPKWIQRSDRELVAIAREALADDGMTEMERRFAEFWRRNWDARSR